METIAVHNKDFHADDVFAVAILKLIFPKIKVIRTRDLEELRKVDARIDVGRKYDPKTNDFDHHQKGGAGERENGIPFASAGLIWKNFGKRLVSSDDVFYHIDEKIIQSIDANDVGLDTYIVKKLDPYTISDFISGLNPKWPIQTEKLYNEYFEEAVCVIINLLKREIQEAEGLMKSKKIIRKEIKNSNGDYMILNNYTPWKKTVIEESNLKYVVSYDKIGDQWSILAVPISINSFQNRKDLPKEWAGLVNEDLQKVTGVKDAKFCHNNLFIAISKTKKGAIELVELALKN